MRAEKLMFSLSIVTYNNKSVIRECLDSLLEYTIRYKSIQITVVDNKSVDSTPEILRYYCNKYENINYIQNEFNAGYGYGHNLAIKNTKSKYHIICNPDIVFTSNIFPLLEEFMTNNLKIGMVCPKFINRDGSLQPLNHLHPTIVDLFLRRFLPNRFTYLFKHRLDKYEMMDVGYDKIHDVPFITGAFMCCRTDVLKAIGGFDERFFLYFEDADLSRRFQDKNYRTTYYPSVSVLHHWQRTPHKNIKMMLILIINGIRYFNKWGYKIM